MLWGNQVVEADKKTFRRDEKNPDPRLRSRSLQNVVLLTGLTYKDEEWANGKIYDAPSGKTYRCKVELKDDKMHLPGFRGVSLPGKTVVWNRVK